MASVYDITGTYGGLPAGTAGSYAYRPQSGLDPRRLASYMAASGNLNRQFGQNLRSVEQTGWGTAARAGLSGPAAATFARSGLADLLTSRSNAMSGLNTDYLQNEAAANEADLQRAFERGTDLLHGQQSLYAGAQGDQRAAAMEAFKTWLQRKLIRAQQTPLTGGGNITNDEWNYWADLGFLPKGGNSPWGADAGDTTTAAGGGGGAPGVMQRGSYYGQRQGPYMWNGTQWQYTG